MKKTIKDYNGNSYSNTSNGNSGSSQNCFNGTVSSGVDIVSLTNNNVISIHIGTGDTTPTPDDYTLESPLTSSSVSRTSSAPNSSALLDENNNIIGVRRSVTFQNITSSDIVVKEIGTFLRASINSSNTSTFLIERTVLSSPVTLEPNGTITVAFDVTY